MHGFVFHCPVRVTAGKGSLGALGAGAASFSRRALLVCGVRSARRSGALAAAVASLKAAGVEVFLHEGVKPNPLLAHARAGAAAARRHKCGVVAALGGGSVIDEAKCIAAAALYPGDPWYFFTGQAEVRRALPLIAVPTAPGSGSEFNNGMVLTGPGGAKLTAQGAPLFPRLALLDPALAAGLPPYQLACGTADALSHLLEAFLTGGEDAPAADEITAALARRLLAAAATLLRRRGGEAELLELFWLSGLAASGLALCGYRRASFTAHALEHSLSALHGTAHGAGLAIIMPALFRARLAELAPRLAAFGRLALGLKARGEKKAAALTVARLEKLFVSWGLPVRLRGAGVKACDIPGLAGHAQAQLRAWGLCCPPQEAAAVLKRAL